MVSNGICQNRGTGVGGCPAADPSEGIVGEVLDCVAVGVGGNPVVIVVGIAGGMGVLEGYINTQNRPLSDCATALDDIQVYYADQLRHRGISQSSHLIMNL